VPELDAWAIVALIGVGLLAGTLGGLLGVGGSVVMIPAMVMLFGQDRSAGLNQHVYQSAAMAVNVAVALPAAWRHRRAGATRADVLGWMLPAALGCIFVGVWLSNRVSDPAWLARLLAAFLIYVIYLNARKLVAGRPTTAGVDGASGVRAGLTGGQRARAGGVGAAMGTVAGLLGIGGGALAVPMQQVFLRLPLRSCIANSSAVICVTAGFGAAAKLSSLPAGLSVATALTIAAVLAPTAIVGGLIGASLTHRLPLRTVRVVFIALMAVAAWKLATG
jgi:uncharacterized membrane protein YfcA